MIVENRDIKKLFKPKIVINNKDIDMNTIKQINSIEYKYKLVRIKSYWIYLEEKNRQKRYYKVNNKGVEYIKNENVKHIIT